MAKRKKRRRAWTSSELRELKTMARKKSRASQIAKKMRRTEGATRQKAFSIGLSLDSRNGGTGPGRKTGGTGPRVRRR
jgi:hypothetical protein